MKRRLCAACHGRRGGRDNLAGETSDSRTLLVAIASTHAIAWGITGTIASVDRGCGIVDMPGI